MTARSLEGLRILSCRQVDRGAELDAEIEKWGGTVIRLPLIEVVPPPDGGAALTDALGRLEEYNWVACTSVNGVIALRGVELPSGLRLAAVGSATADAFERILGRNALVVPEVPTAAGLAAAFPSRPGRVLAPLAELAGPDLAAGLARRGYEVDVVIAYATAIPEHSAKELDRAATADVVLVSSPSVARRVTELLGDRRPSMAVAIGPKSAAQANDLGFTVIETTPDHVVSALASLRI
ncbi:MAG: uroporphyrinogen-III synthase [Acidimicrobiia bacterium]|nr:uroporphyrinogen-III synthase [Acidimicrobiia bacterium]